MQDQTSFIAYCRKHIFRNEKWCHRDAPTAWTDYRFSGAIKERLKRQRFTPFAYFTAPKSYYPQVFITPHYKDLRRFRPPKALKLSEKQANLLRNRRAMYGQTVPQKTVGTFSNADFCDGDGDGDRKSDLFLVDFLHFGRRLSSLCADVRTTSFPVSTKREYIFFAFMHSVSTIFFLLVSEGLSWET